MFPMKILILNGPPNVGKDTLADKLIEDSDEDWFKLSNAVWTDKDIS